jgi:phage FluMu gp28-like protein
MEASIDLTAPLCMRGCLDATGLGMQIAERMAEKYGSRVEPVTFTSMVKHDLAIGLKSKFEERLIRIPSDRELRRDINAVKRVTTVAGNIRYDAERTKDGHSDRFWSLGLAIHADGVGGVGPPDFAVSDDQMAYTQAGAY